MNGLTESQRLAVTTQSKDTLVIAGAGAGKTRVLTERVVELLQRRGLSASELLVLTFTRKAAGELKYRVRAALLGDDDKEDAGDPTAGMLIGTFHSVALKILREHGYRLGYTPASMTIIDADDSDYLLEQVCKDLGYVHGKKWRSGMSMKQVRRWVDQKYTGILATGRPEIARIFVEYLSRLFAMNALDFGMILQQTNRLFQLHPDVLESYRQRIKAVLVDEAQDADLVQYNMHEWFRGHAEFFAVGDTRQTIYTFRGARPDLMRERHPDAYVINLRECFRCSDDIVGVANLLIAHNREELAEPMIGATGRTAGYETIAGRSEDLAAYVRGLGDQGYAWKDIAVMARSHRQLKRLGAIFAEQKIPFHRVGATFDICDTPAFKALHAALRLVVNPRDNMAFLRLHKSLGVPQDQYAAIRGYAAAQGVSDYDAFKATNPGHCVVRAMDQELLTAYRYAQHIIAAMESSKLGEYSRYSAYWIDNCGDMVVEAALRWHALRDSQDDVGDRRRVTLLTVHAAKGLEWPCVIVANLQEATFPSAQAIRGDGVPDERRLAYVAYTRAKERLVLHYRRPEDQNVERGIKKPSRFLYESCALNEGVTNDLATG